MNKCIMLGNLTKDISLFSGGVGKSTIAVNRRYKNANGEIVDEPCFLDLVLFGRNAEIAHQYLHKGKKVLVEGRIQQENYTTNDGRNMTKYSLVVEHFEMIDSPKKESQEPNLSQTQPNLTAKPSQKSADKYIDENDLIPF